MAARTHRKGFKPLPEAGWSEEWGTWEDYVERCVHEGARVGTGDFGEYIEWINDDGIHREDGPAFEYKDAYKQWWANNRLHRKNGPAFENVGGIKAFWKEGIQYTDITFTQRVRS